MLLQMNLQRSFLVSDVRGLDTSRWNVFTNYNFCVRLMTRVFITMHLKECLLMNWAHHDVLLVIQICIIESRILAIRSLHIYYAHATTVRMSYEKLCNYHCNNICKKTKRISIGFKSRWKIIYEMGPSFLLWSGASIVVNVVEPAHSSHPESVKIVDRLFALAINKN